METKQDEKQAKLEAMEQDKERKIRHYMELQDQADAMNEQTIRFRLGIFVLAALILLAVLIMLFGGWARFFQR